MRDGGAGEVRAFRLEALEQRRLLAAFHVDTSVDVIDPDDGVLSLREAVVAANDTPGEDLITFDIGLAGEPVVVTEGEIAVTDGLTIRGLGASNVAIDAGGLSRIFNISDGSGSTLIDVVIEDVTLQGGFSAFDGGAVFSRERLTIRDAVFTENHADRGGAIRVSGELEIVTSLFTENTADDDGAAVYADFADIVIERSTLSANASQDNGGALSIAVSDLHVNASTFVANDAAGHGGALYTFQTDVTIINSTVSSNRALGNGGGVRFGSGTQLIANSTVAENIADADNDGDGRGGGLFVLNVSTPRLVSTVVAGNAKGPDADEVSGDLTASSSNNLIQDAATSGGLFNGPNGNIVGLDPLLGDLVDTAGPTKSYIPLSASPLIDAGTNSEGESFDQRGSPYSRSSGNAPDIGAVEIQQPLIVSLVGSAPTVVRGSAYTLAAQGVSIVAGAVDEVLVYADRNGNGVPDASELLAVTTAASLYSVTLGGATTSSFAAGSFGFLARARSGDIIGPVASLSVNVSNETPTVQALVGDAASIVQGEDFEISATLDDGDVDTVAVRFYVDDNRNGLVEDEELIGEDGDGSDGWSLTVSADMTRAFDADTVFIQAIAVDGEGDRSEAAGTLVGVLYSIRALDDAAVNGTADATDAHFIGTVNRAGDPLIFDVEEGTAIQLARLAGAPAALDDVIVWTDPKDGLVRAAYPSASGLILASRQPGGVWTVRNLNQEVPESLSPVRSLTQFASTNGLVVIAGITTDGKIVVFQQNGLRDDNGFIFDFVNVSDDHLAPQGHATPVLQELISYRPAWNAWHLAGIDDNGDIISVWTAPEVFTEWRLSNLSSITGAAPLAGGLSVILTSWGGINLTGVSAAGDLMVTWWVPSFGGNWSATNLTSAFVGPKLRTGSLTAYYTGWDGMNYAGIDDSGRVTIYWWVPQFGGRWVVSPITTSGALDNPAGALRSLASDAGTLNLFAATDDRSIVRTWWQPGGDWITDNLSMTAERV